jgi:hypothetical protein
MEKIIDFCQKYPTAPIQCIVDHPEWLIHPEFKFLSTADKEVIAAINNCS